jgi:RNA polymerase sigma factor (sigma-70 family)
MNQPNSPRLMEIPERPPPPLRSVAAQGVDRSVAPDAYLLAASGQDPDAFRVIYDRYHARLGLYFGRRTGDADAALELCAETFSRAWIMRGRFRDEYDGSIAPWLFGIARNVLLMSIRKGEIDSRAAARLGVIERLDLGPGRAAPVADWSDGADELLDSLPISQSDALRLRIVDEYDYDEVARALGTSRSTARVRVHRGLSALRHRLSDTSREETP